MWFGMLIILGMFAIAILLDYYIKKHNKATKLNLHVKKIEDK